MRLTDNRLNVSKPGADITLRHKKTAHLPSMNMETRRRQRGERSTIERLHG